jgi:hypothetical protein
MGYGILKVAGHCRSRGAKSQGFFTGLGTKKAF